MRSLLDHWRAAYVAIALFTFAFSASDHNGRQCKHDGKVVECGLGVDAFAGLLSAAVWPLYWSWELAEAARAA